MHCYSWGDRSFHPFHSTMANAGNGRLRSAAPSASHIHSDVVDLCSDSSGDKATRLAGSPSVDSDATLSEESDADSAAKCLLAAFIAHFYVMT